MKTMHKRVLALLMALVLMFSCTAFASAAEAAPAWLDFAPVVSSAGSDDGIMPLAQQEISAGGATSFKDGKFNVGLFAKRTPYVQASAGENCLLTVTIKKDDGTLIKTTNINLSANKGMTVKLTDSALGYGTYRYEIRWNKTGIDAYYLLYLQW